MKIINRHNQAKGGQRNDRQLNQITHIVVHHTASNRNATTATFERGVWRNHDWDRGGYHEVVLANGNVELNYIDRRIVWGARNQNTHTWHIAMVGQHGAGVNNITQIQLRNMERRIAEACRRLNITNMNRIVVHNALPGQATACTSVDIANVRRNVEQLLNTNNQQPAQTGNVHIVQRGETLSQIARRHNTTVAELTRLNNIVNPNLIQVGQRITLPNRGNQSVENNTTLRVGSRVRVNQNANRWVTGENIPAFIRGGTFNVMQIGRNGNNNHILIGRNGQVTGWINRNDITII